MAVDDEGEHTHEQTTDVILEQNDMGAWRIRIELTDTPTPGDPCPDVLVTSVTLDLSEASELATLIISAVVHAKKLDIAGRN